LHKIFFTRRSWRKYVHQELSIVHYIFCCHVFDWSCVCKIYGAYLFIIYLSIILTKIHISLHRHEFYIYCTLMYLAASCLTLTEYICLKFCWKYKIPNLSYITSIKIDLKLNDAYVYPLWWHCLSLIRYKSKHFDDCE
jgi:hypothetical protein